MLLTRLPRIQGRFVPQQSVIQLLKHEMPKVPEDPCSDSEITWLAPLQLKHWHLMQNTDETERSGFNAKQFVQLVISSEDPEDDEASVDPFQA